eukprot:4432173-Prymnesium_polylepis.2
MSSERALRHSINRTAVAVQGIPKVRQRYESRKVGVNCVQAYFASFTLGHNLHSLFTIYTTRTCSGSDERSGLAR